MPTLIRVRDVEPIEGFRVRLRSTDGSERVRDLEPYPHRPIFEPLLRDPLPFAAVRVDAELGAIVRPNGADIDPDVPDGGHRPAARTGTTAGGPDA
jgi:hypothetical protein